MPEQYEKQECIGRGSFGEVYKGVEIKSGKVVALKLVDLEKADDEIEIIQREIKVMSQISNPYVVQYYTSLTKESTLWIIMEYMSSGSLKDLIDSIGPLPEEAIHVILKSLLQGLNYIHKERKVHRDVKCANILLSHNGDIKLADFGVARQMTQTNKQVNTFVGSPFWMAPEVIQESLYDEKADIWSVGITVIELAKGLPPYANEHPYQALFLIPKNNPPNLDGTHFSKHLKDFVHACLKRIPTDRSSAEELLNFPFLKNKPKSNHVIKDLLKKKDQLENQKNQHQHFNYHDHDSSINADTINNNNIHADENNDVDDDDDDNDIVINNDSIDDLKDIDSTITINDNIQHQLSDSSLINNSNTFNHNGNEYNKNEDLIESTSKSASVPAQWDFDAVVEENEKDIEVDKTTTTSSEQTKETNAKQGGEKERTKSMPAIKSTSIAQKDEEDDKNDDNGDGDGDDDDYGGTFRRKRAESFDLGSIGNESRKRSGSLSKLIFEKEIEEDSNDILTQLILPVISQMRSDVDASSNSNENTESLIQSLGNLEVCFLECENSKKGCSKALMESLIKTCLTSSSKSIQNMLERCLSSTCKKLK